MLSIKKATLSGLVILFFSQTQYILRKERIENVIVALKERKK